ncbi:MAG: YdeI/OmpD-associated family protein [Proteobacteria bacterium]|nr:YdeI/OmpD-associated family protein [Pseudomonadota bacterium]
MRFPRIKKALAKNAPTRKGFANLRPGLQREYTDHVVSAKRDETKTKRIEKILPMIAAGIGLNDIYR